MFNSKTSEPSRTRSPLEGRLLEGRGVEAPNIVDLCQEAIDKGRYTVLAERFPRGVIARLDLTDESLVAAISLDRDTQKGEIYMLHRANGNDEDLAQKMTVAAFGAR